MNAESRLPAGAWVSGAMTPEAANKHIETAAARADEVERTGHSFRRAGWWTGAAGVAVGLLGMGTAAWVLGSAEPSRPFFALVTPGGEVTPVVGAADAPRLFSEDTAKQYLARLIEVCDGYVPQMAAQNFKRCTLMLTSEQQARYAAVMAAANPASPQRRYGTTGHARPENIKFTHLPSTGRVQSWHVSYDKVETRGVVGALSTIKQSGTVHFEWRPELRMSPEDRTWNTAGMQVIAMTVTADVAR